MGMCEWTFGPVHIQLGDKSGKYRMATRSIVQDADTRARIFEMRVNTSIPLTCLCRNWCCSALRRANSTHGPTRTSGRGGRRSRSGVRMKKAVTRTALVGVCCFSSPAPDP